jgi:hypothetical protein
MNSSRLIRTASSIAAAMVMAALSWPAVTLGARGSDSGSTQEPVISRSAPMTLTGEIVEITCYRQKGVAASTGAAHVACAKVCVLEKNAALGILSDGDGLFRLWGAMTRDKYGKLLPHVGQTVTITGTEVVLSNNYDVRSFDVQSIKTGRRGARR